MVAKAAAKVCVDRDDTAMDTHMQACRDHYSCYVDVLETLPVWWWPQQTVSLGKDNYTVQAVCGSKVTIRLKAGSVHLSGSCSKQLPDGVPKPHTYSLRKGASSGDMDMFLISAVAKLCSCGRKA